MHKRPHAGSHLLGSILALVSEKIQRESQKRGVFVIVNTLTNSRIGGISLSLRWGGGGHVIGNEHRYPLASMGVGGAWGSRNNLLTGESTPRDIQQAPSMQCTDRQLWWPKKILTLKNERKIIPFYLIIIFCSSSMNHERPLSCFVLLSCATWLWISICLTFVCFVQFCNFYFCTLDQINECVHSCVNVHFIFTYQVAGTIKFPLIRYIIYWFLLKSHMNNINLKKCLPSFFAECIYSTSINDDVRVTHTHIL